VPSWDSAKATVQDGHELVAWLAERVMPNEQRADHVREAVFERCRVLRLEPPSTGRIDRLGAVGLSYVRGAAVLERLGVTSQHALDELLVTGRAEDGTDAETAEGSAIGPHRAEG